MNHTGIDQAEEEDKDEGSMGLSGAAVGPSLFVCPRADCKKTFTRKVRLKAHMHIHNGTQPYKCPYPGCGKAFSEKQNLKIHKRIHSDVRPYACP